MLQHEIPAINIFSTLAEIMRNTPAAINTYLYAEQLRIENNRSILNHTMNNIVYLNKTKEPLGEILDKATQDLVSLSQNITSKEIGMNMAKVLAIMVDEMDAAFDGQRQLKLLTGFKQLDNYLQGLRPGQLIVLAARPSQGKTTLALNIMHDIMIAQEKHVMLFSLEMGETEIARSLLSMHSAIPLALLKDDRIAENELMFTRFGWAVGSLNKGKMQVVTEGATIGKIKQAARDYKRKYPELSFIVIDYLQLISKPKSESRVLEIAAITRELKLLAKELNIPIMALSQLNRNNEARVDKTPILSDLRDSGSIEQDADMVIFIHRNDKEAKIIVGKNRSGACGELRLCFDGA